MSASVLDIRGSAGLHILFHSVGLFNSCKETPSYLVYCSHSGRLSEIARDRTKLGHSNVDSIGQINQAIPSLVCREYWNGI